MASRRSPSAPEWQVILEAIESQNRLMIEAVEANRVVPEGRIEEVRTDLGGRLTNVEKAVAVLAGRADGTDRRFDGIDNRLDGIDHRLDGIEGRFDSLEARIEAREAIVDHRLDLIAAALERVETESRGRHAALEVGLRELRVSVLQVAAEVHELRVKVEQNSADIRDLSARLTALSRLEERVSALEKRTA